MCFLTNLDHFTNSRTSKQAVTESLDAAFNLYLDYDQFGYVLLDSPAKHNLPLTYHATG